MGDRQAATLARPATAFHCRTESSREFAANATLAAVGLPATVSANERDEPRLGAARTACATKVAAAEAQTYLHLYRQADQRAGTAPVPRAVTLLTDRFVKGENGRWLIARRVVDIVAGGE